MVQQHLLELDHTLPDESEAPEPHHLGLPSYLDLGDDVLNELDALHDDDL
jgi:hypothetical protein